MDQPCGIIRLIPDSEMIVTGSRLFLSLLHFLSYYYCPNSQYIVGSRRVVEALRCVWRVARVTWSPSWLWRAPNASASARALLAVDATPTPTLAESTGLAGATKTVRLRRKNSKRQVRPSTGLSCSHERIWQRACARSRRRGERIQTTSTLATLMNATHGDPGRVASGG